MAIQEVPNQKLEKPSIESMERARLVPQVSMIAAEVPSVDINRNIDDIFWALYYDNLMDRPLIKKRIAEKLDDLSDIELQSIFNILNAKSMEPPSSAPELYKDRVDRSEGPIEFLTRVYEPYLDGQLTRAHLRKIDHQLYAGIYAWLSDKKNKLPDFIKLPTQKEANSAKVEALESIADLVGGPRRDSSNALQGLRRVALDRRQK